MPWQNTKTWVAGPWTFPEANKYIRDNMRSIRGLTNATKVFQYELITVTNANVSIDHYGLMDSAPDDQINVNLFWMGQMTGPLAGATTMNASVKNDVGVTQASFGPFTITEIDCVGFRSWVSPAGINPGLSLVLNAQPSGSVAFKGSMIVSFTPVI